MSRRKKSVAEKLKEKYGVQSMITDNIDNSQDAGQVEEENQQVHLQVHPPQQQQGQSEGTLQEQGEGKVKEEVDVEGSVQEQEQLQANEEVAVSALVQEQEQPQEQAKESSEVQEQPQEQVEEPLEVQEQPQRQGQVQVPLQQQQPVYQQPPVQQKAQEQLHGKRTVAEVRKELLKKLREKEKEKVPFHQRFIKRTDHWEPEIRELFELEAKTYEGGMTALLNDVFKKRYGLK